MSHRDVRICETFEGKQEGIKETEEKVKVYQNCSARQHETGGQDRSVARYFLERTPSMGRSLVLINS